MRKVTFFADKKISPAQQQKALDKAVSEYSTQFLFRHTFITRHALYISRDTFKVIARIVHIIGKNVTVSGYVDNVMRKHLEQYKDEINELYQKEMNDLI